MRVIGDHVVHRDEPRAGPPRSFSGTTVTAAHDERGGTRLLCAFRSGDERLSPDGRIPLFGSADDGRTWERRPSPLDEAPDVPGPATAFGEAGLAGSHIGADPAGTTLLTAARMWTVPAGAEGYDEQAGGIVEADSISLRSTASGGWEAPVAIDARRHDDEWAIPCGPPVSLGGGEWLFPLERHAKAHVPEWLRGYHALAALSHDDGRTWSEQLPMLNDLDRRVAHYDQRCVALADGRVLSLAWAHDVIDDVTLDARAGWSEDGGRSWSAAVDTGIVGGPINPLALPDGRILAVYARRTAPRGVRACLSEDGGRSWRTDDELLIFDEASGRVIGARAGASAPANDDEGLWDTMWAWTFGQPVPALLSDGGVGVAFYCHGDDARPMVRFVRLALDG